jgi:hypothetical protein
MYRRLSRLPTTLFSPSRFHPSTLAGDYLLSEKQKGIELGDSVMNSIMLAQYTKGKRKSVRGQEDQKGVKGAIDSEKPHVNRVLIENDPLT